MTNNYFSKASMALISYMSLWLYHMLDVNKIPYYEDGKPQKHLKISYTRENQN